MKKDKSWSKTDELKRELNRWHAMVNDNGSLCTIRKDYVELKKMVLDELNRHDSITQAAYNKGIEDAALVIKNAKYSMGNTRFDLMDQIRTLIKEKP